MKSFRYSRGPEFSVTCNVDVHGMVTMMSIIVPAGTEKEVTERFLEEAEEAAIKAASNDADVRV